MAILNGHKHKRKTWACATHWINYCVYGHHIIKISPLLPWSQPVFTLYSYMELATSDNGPTGFHKEDTHGSFIILTDFFTHWL